MLEAAGLKVATLGIEGQKNFDGLQQFLSNVPVLTGERRLLRFVYLPEKLETRECSAAIAP